MSITQRHSDFPGATELVELSSEDPSALVDCFAARGWGDGLPLIAPTPGRVEAMLAGCAADPDEAVATLPPRSGVATRRIIAINAVLAGCRREHLPVLVAAAEALARPEVNLRGVNATTHPVAPLLIVHGEIARTAGYNAGLGAFGSGNLANAATGRALRMLLMHVAGAVPGAGDAATQGGPAKYSYCVAENLARSPWGGYAPSVGVDTPSAVTVHCGEAPHNVHDMESSDPAPILDKAASAMASLGSNHAPVSGAEFFVMLCPEHAAACSSAGWTREHVASYLFERARLPAGDLRAGFALRAWAPWQEALADGAPMAVTEHPGNIKVVVVGGDGKHSSVIPSWGMTRSVTVPVEQ